MTIGRSRLGHGQIPEGGKEAGLHVSVHAQNGREAGGATFESIAHKNPTQGAAIAKPAMGMAVGTRTAAPGSPVGPASAPQPPP